MKKINIENVSLFYAILILLSILFVPILGSLFNLIFVTSYDKFIKDMKNFLSISYIIVYLTLLITLLYK